MAIPQPEILSDVLARTAARFADREAFVAPGERLTWSQLHAEVRALARAFAAHGVQRGDHVGILLPNGADWVRCFYACATLGAVTVPINTRFKTDELAYCLKQADISTLIYAGRFLNIDYTALLRAVEPAIDSALPGTALPRLARVLMVGDGTPPAGAQAFAQVIPQVIPQLSPQLIQQVTAASNVTEAAASGDAAQPVTPEDVLLIQYTSGTTSFPKGVMLSHRNMLGNAAAAAARIGVRADDRYFSIRPYYHVAGTTMSLLVALQTGACLLTLPSFDVAESLRMLDRERCTLTSGNDTIFLMLMGHADFDRGRMHLRGGWAAAGPEVMQQIRDVMGVPHVCNAYGLSEASPNVVLSAWDEPFEVRAAGRARPHEGIAVRIADPDSGALQAVDASGEIQVRGWSVMKGYYNMPEATAKAFTADGWLRTGDLGAIDADGRLRMIGRIKDVFRVGGENVAPAEVEETLHAHPAVQQAQVIGVPDVRLGEVAAAYVVLKAGQGASADELIAWCKARCANFKVPRYLRVVNTFEDIGMTGSSKVQKGKLREQALLDFNIVVSSVVSR
ncbi:MAG: fatty-acid--CoA ligase [Betaproteobacteria bacterium]|nr:fatty-acid--CoA ligase [Betaproteobacteria bacterium]